MQRKRGQLSHEEQSFIRAHADRGAAWVAERLNRTEDAISRYMKTRLRAELKADRAAEASSAIRAELKNSHMWRALRSELTKDEMDFFEEGYVKLSTQFRGDILASEEFQIFDAIRLDVLKGRNLTAQKKVKEEMARAERALAKAPEDEVKAAAAQVRDLRSAMSDLASEYTGLLEARNDLLKALKATREARIKEVNSGKDTVLGLIKQMQNEEWREMEGRELALARLAADREHARLSALHVYEDGQADRPILTPESHSAEAPRTE